MLLSITISISAGAQDTIPDRWEEDYRASISYWPNSGQYVDMAGDPIIGLRFVSDGTYPTVLLHDNSLVSLVLEAPDSLPGYSTITRVDFRPVGEGAAEVNPVGQVQREHFRS